MRELSWGKYVETVYRYTTNIYIKTILRMQNILKGIWKSICENDVERWKMLSYLWVWHRAFQNHCFSPFRYPAWIYFIKYFFYFENLPPLFLLLLRESEHHEYFMHIFSRLQLANSSGFEHRFAKTGLQVIVKAFRPSIEGLVSSSSIFTKYKWWCVFDWWFDWVVVVE